MRYHNITKSDMLNGDGLRVVLWVAGCTHGCPDCQNPITWDPKGGLLFDQAAKEEIFEELKKEYISGITFSGGDPFYMNNRQDVKELIKEIRSHFPEKTIWLYTGFTWDAVKDLEFMNQIDVLIDGKFERDHRDLDLHWCGSSNQNVIDVKESLESQRLVLYE